MKTKKILSILLSVCVILAFMPQMAFADTYGTTEDGFSYTISDAGKVTITSYTGEATGVTIPNEIDNKPVTSIGDCAFNYRTNLTSVTIPGSVTSIGYKAFAGCTGLASINIPGSVTSIGVEAFDGCTNLKSVTISDGVTSIGDSAFNYCTSLESINIPGSVTSIGNGVFYGCTSLKSVTISDGVTSIGDSAFNYCTSLESINIPGSVTSIGVEAFARCTSLTSIVVADSNTAYSSEDGVLFTKYKTQLIQYPLGNTNKEYSIPESVTIVAGGAFNGCTSLESVTIPGSITSSSYAFDGCTSLKSVTISDGVTSIGDYAFNHCTSLESVTIPSGVKSIGSQAFYQCTSLKSVTIPESVTSIGNFAFYGCTSLASVTIPSGVKSIGRQAFYQCTSLTSVNIPGSITSIGDRAFARCTSLASINIPGSVTSIGVEAFAGCTSLASVTISDGVTSIDNGAFAGCTSLASINIPESVTSIGNFAFYGCTSLESTFLPVGLDVSSANIPVGATQVRYSLDTDNCMATIAEIKLGTGKTSVSIPETICGYQPASIFLPAGLDVSNISIPVGASQARYSLDTSKDEITITEIQLGTDQNPVAIPTTILGYPVVAVAEAYQNLVGIHTHKLVNIPGKAPTYSEAGYKEYWHCTLCDKFFSDAECTTVITDLDSWKAGEGKIDKLTVPTKTDSVTTDKDGGVTVTLERSVTTSDSKTTATVTDAVANQILAKLASSDSKSVVIDASAGTAASTSVVISESALKKLAEAEGIKITLITDSGKVVLDNKAIAAVVASAGSDGQVTLNIETVEKSNNLLKVDISISTSGGYVTDFKGGKVTVTVVIDDELKGKNPVAVYIDDNGRYYKIGGKLNDDGTFTFVTGHFSTYAVMPEAEADKVIKNQEIAAVRSIKSTVTLTTKNIKRGIKVSVKIPASQKADKTGIIIYRSLKKNSGYAMYKKVKTSGSTYTITNALNVKGNRLVKGKRYYYKARVYKVIDGKTYYGLMSSIKYIRAK